MKKASAFAPGHLTGFFQICVEDQDPLRKGARGAGVSIVQGVKTTVKAEISQKSSTHISINGKTIDNAIVSENVLKRMLQESEKKYAIDVEHCVEIPLGAGFGSSGGGALTLALALNEVLGLGMTKIEAAQEAHLAELECGTGLGSVYAAFVGGFGTLVEAGAPGLGRSLKYERSQDLSVIYLHFGPMPTKEALSDEMLRKKINELGGRFVDRFKNELTPSLFMELSRCFTNYVGITTPRLDAVLKAAEKNSIPCAMAMFGETLFSLVWNEETESIVSFFEEVAPNQRVNSCPIDDLGARLL